MSRFSGRLASILSRRTGILAGAVAFSVVAVTVWVLVGVRDYRETRAANERSGVTLTLALEEHVRRSLGSAMLALNRVNDRVGDEDFATWSADRDHWLFAKSIADELPQVSSISLIDAQGEIRMITTEFPAPRVNVRDREYFTAHAAKGERSYLGHTIIARSTGKPIFTLSIRLTDRTGTFRGVLLASMEVAYFRKFYRSLDLASDTSIVLLRADGKTIAREPMTASFVGADLSNEPWFRMVSEGMQGIRSYTSPFDGRERRGAFRRLADYPIIVVAAASQEMTDVPVRRRLAVSGAALACILLMVGGFTVMQLRGLTREQNIHLELAHSRDFADAILDSVSSSIAILDKSGTIIRTNQPWQEFARKNDLHSPADCIGLNYLEVCEAGLATDPDTALDALNGIREVITGCRANFSMEYPCHFPDEERWFEMRATPMRTATGGAVIAHVNITRMKRVEMELRQMATTDSLTQLANRRALLNAAEQEFVRAKRYGHALAVLMLDCDHFKIINDRHGHGAGDAVLASLGDTIRSTIRQTDHAGRLGGEEFAIVSAHTDIDGACQLAERLRAAVEATQVETTGGLVRVTVSLGIAMLTTETASFNDLLMRADAALYRAKENGRNRVEWG